MKNKIYIPQMNYIVFELIGIDVNRLESEGEAYKADQIETIYLATFPEQFRFSKVARDAIVQTDKTIFLQKFNYQPEKVKISGTFGDKPRMIAGTLMHGWSRLKQFEEIVINKSKEHKILWKGAPDESQYLYALNYYDFAWQRFGNINIRSFEVSGNARVNTNMPMYNCEFIIIGDLIKSIETDPILITLTSILGEDGLVNMGTEFVNEALADLEPIFAMAGWAFEGLNIASGLVSESVSFINELGEVQFSNVNTLF